MAADLSAARSVAPVASVWCRQVDHEAESPGYTSIPDDFPGRRETLEAIRTVGHLTINVADTHDYWDPDPSATLSYYPNLFVYPAAGGRYTCVGRMFLSTEDRPRLGMKTLVFSTSELIETGRFGEMVVRALASLDGRAERGRPEAEPDPAVYQAVGEGFLFHRGTTEPVVVVASEQWEAACRAVADVIVAMPASLVALGAFLVFPYFLPAAKIDLRQFTEETPLALAVMRVPRQEAEGDRHAKRMESWGELPVSLRDLTRPGGARAKDALPLVLQYVRDKSVGKETEVARRVDQVEGPKLTAHLADPDRQLGRDRRREMWRIGTAMETAALLLSRPKGRTVRVSAETQKRANQYLEAQPGENVLLAPTPEIAPPSDPGATPAAAASSPPPGPAPASAPPAPPSNDLPSWLRPSGSIAPVSGDPGSVPVSIKNDPSLRPTAPRPAEAPAAPTASGARSPPPTPAPPVVARPAPTPAVAAPVAPPSPSIDVAAVDARIARAVAEAERRWTESAENRFNARSESADAAARATADQLSRRLDALEQRPAVLPDAVAGEVEQKVRAWADLRALEADRRVDETVLEPLIALVRRVDTLEHRPAVNPEQIRTDLDTKLRAGWDQRLAESERKASEAARSSTESWADRLRRELQQAVDELAARSTKAEEELRASLAAQIDLEVLEAKEQGSAVREEVEGRVRELLANHFAEADRRRTQEVRDFEAKVAALTEGRSKEIEQRLTSTFAQNADRLTAALDDRVSHVERRLAAERDARLTEFTEAHRAAVVGVQNRLQAQLEQKVREARSEDEQRANSLAARTRAELQAAIEGRLAGPEFDSNLDGRISRIVAMSRSQQSEELARVVADAEQKIAAAREEAVAQLTDLQQRLAAREGDYANLEEALRTEVDDLDRRLMVVNDHVLPLVRQTWLKVSEQEFAARAKVTESRLAAVRQELSEEIRRVEGELLQQQSDLRDRLEASVASHGRIWLNLLRQMSPDGSGMPSPATPGSHRIPRRARVANPSLPSAADSAALPADSTPFADDPPNPMDPELGRELESKGGSRRPRRS